MILRSRYLAFSRTVNNRPIVLPVVGVVILLSLFAGYQTSARWLGLILAVYGAFILLERLQLGLIALVIATFIVPFAIGTNSMTSINVTILLAAFLLGLWILRVAQMRLGFRIFRTWIPLFAFVGVSIVSFIGGNLPWSYFAGRAGVSAQVGGLAIIVLSVGMYCLVGSQVGTLKWLKSISWVFLGMGWLLVASRLLRGVFDVRGLFVGYSDGSLFWVWLMALAFGQLVFNSRLRGRGRWFLATLLAAALYVAWFQNRNWASGWLPMLVTLGVIVYLRSWRLGVLLTLAAILLVMIAKPSLVAELISQDRYSIDTRLPAWTIVLQIVQVSPLIGLGPANYYFYTPLFPILGWYVKFSSHNNFIDIIAQTGLIGFGFFVWFIIEVARLGWRLRTHFNGGDFAQGYVNAVLGGLVGTLTACMLADWFLPFVYNVGLAGFRASVFGWLFLGGLVSLEQIARRESESQVVQMNPAEVA